MSKASSRSIWRAAAALALLHCGVAGAQFHHRAKAVRVPPSTTMTFIKKDGSCVEGRIAKIEPKTLTIQTQAGATQSGAAALSRESLLQASQAGSLVFSARSSWADVEAVHLRPPESFELKLRSGKVVKGQPLRVTDDGFVFKRIAWLTTRYFKTQIVTVDYLRVKPVSDGFDYFTQAAPALLFFYPDSYDRLKNDEGRIPVRLYDAVQKEDDAALQCSR